MTITPEIVAEHGLSSDEYQQVLTILGREPNLTELGVFSVMWSEHCSYKSSKKWLKTLPTEAPWVIQGPGENAGVIDLGDNHACVFKIESHNHPSFIEPYQGAATGVGGIMRDVFTMGARPVANLNALRFGSPDHAKTRHLISGVVSGIGGYGNCMGVPTVGGEVNFHPAYNGNILVNAMTVGLAPADRIFYAKAAGIGNPVIYVGAKTGRDGIHGATMASAEFTEESESKRPTVQVGDPFTEKLLLEACLELMAEDAIIAIQDMGAAGLTSSSVEMTSKGGVGLEMTLDDVPQREESMSAYEIMLSESQERMLMILKPGTEEKAKAIFDKWDLDFAVIGKLTDTGHIVLKHHGDIVADIPVAPLVDKAPEYDRPWTEPVTPAPLSDADLPVSDNIQQDLLKMIADPALCSRAWIYEQYDYTVMNDTMVGPGSDAALVRVHGSQKAMAMTTDCTPRYCLADPYQGGAQAVCEAYRNLCASGAKPLAVTNNLNFGNPERPEIMGQIVKAVEGMGDACRTLDFPVVSGNVSLYNETESQAILPTPVIGGVGLVEDIDAYAQQGVHKADLDVYLIGDSQGHLGQSLYLSICHNQEIGQAPAIDLNAEKNHGQFVQQLIAKGSIPICHDLSDGGLAIACAEMVAAGSHGLAITLPDTHMSDSAYLFGEDQARYLVCVDPALNLTELAKQANISVTRLGKTTEAPKLTIGAAIDLTAESLRTARQTWFAGYMQ